MSQRAPSFQEIVRQSYQEFRRERGQLPPEWRAEKLIDFLENETSRPIKQMVSNLVSTFESATGLLAEHFDRELFVQLQGMMAANLLPLVETFRLFYLEDRLQALTKVGTSLPRDQELDAWAQHEAGCIPFKECPELERRAVSAHFQKALIVAYRLGQLSTRS